MLGMLQFFLEICVGLLKLQYLINDNFLIIR